MLKAETTIDREAFLRRAGAVLPRGASSANRAPWNEVIVRALGAYVWNADNHRFLDFLLGWGPIVLGHCDRRVNEAAARAAEHCDLTAIGPQVGEVELAEAICAVVPSAERVAFCNSGTEATLHAVQVARAATNRSGLLKFHGSYHGWHDSVAVGSRYVSGDGPRPPMNEADAGGLHPGAVADVTVVEWNDLTAVREAFAERAETLAAVICEPYVLSYGCVAPAPGFLERLRELCTEKGVALIFDEVKTGFRADLGGYQAVCGVTPDLTVFAKAIANGYPLAGLAGQAALMGNLEAAGGAVFTGTYNASPHVLAAGLATLEILQEGALDRIRSLGARVREGLTAIIANHGIPASVSGLGSEWVVYFRPTPPTNFGEAQESDLALARRFQELMMAGGILEPVFPLADRRLCAATTDEDIDRTLEVADHAMAQL